MFSVRAALGQVQGGSLLPCEYQLSRSSTTARRASGRAVLTRRWSSSLPDAAPETFSSDSQKRGKSEKIYSDYEHWVRRLYQTNMFNPVKLGLENIEQLHELLGSPMDDVSYLLTLAYFARYWFLQG